MDVLSWFLSGEERRPGGDGPGALVRFAAGQEAGTVRLELELRAEEEVKEPPALSVRSAPVPCRLEPPEGGGTRFRYGLVVDPPADPGADDEVVIDLTGADGRGVPPCRVVLRRSTCALGLALLAGGHAAPDLDPQARAALLWHGWGRFAALVGLKRFGTGRGGGAVVVVRPRLRAPGGPADDSLDSSGPQSVLKNAWGSCLLVKTGPARKVRREWDRCATFLADRAHPFLARCEALLPIRSPDEPGPPERVTLVSSFLGGELVHPEPLEELIRGADDVSRCRRALDQVFAVLGPWQATARTRPLIQWRRVYRGRPDDWLLFGKFDLTLEQAREHRLGRAEFAAGLRWDVPFTTRKHLHHHLLGKDRDGLLHRLGTIKARFGLTHGDLNPRNVLCDGDDVWLIDFEHTGVAPALADYARLEANLRLWCLPLRPSGANVEAAAAALEARLLDHFLGSEGGLEPVRALASRLGADPDDLLKVAHAIAHVRRLASCACLSAYPDRRDYLAVLYLTALNLLHYAAEGAAPPENYRLLIALAWMLEDVLCRLVGLEPFDRGRAALDPTHLLAPEWLDPPGAPRRVIYLLDREDGRRALEPLAAARGVLQSPHHHLDVFDHTLLVLAYAEALLDDPLGGLLDPAALDVRVAAALADQGIHLLPIPAPSADPAPPDVSDLAPFLDLLRERLGEVVRDGPSRLLLKWVALLHDVGKPGTRCLNTAARPPQVQFLGHEYYGLDLLAGHLEHLFPDEPLRRRARRLIEQHHRHHQLGEWYKPGPSGPVRDLKALVSGLSGLDVTSPELKALAPLCDPAGDDYLTDFPLLMLHGYADTLACRGPHSRTPVGEVARIDLALLAYWATLPRLKERGHAIGQEKARNDEMFRRLSEALRVERGRSPGEWKPTWQAVMRDLSPWFRRECRSRQGQGTGGPDYTDLERQARALLAQDRRAGETRPAPPIERSDGP